MNQQELLALINGVGADIETGFGLVVGVRWVTRKDGSQAVFYRLRADFGKAVLLTIKLHLAPDSSTWEFWASSAGSWVADVNQLRTMVNVWRAADWVANQFGLQPEDSRQPSLTD